MESESTAIDKVMEPINNLQKEGTMREPSTPTADEMVNLSRWGRIEEMLEDHGTQQFSNSPPSSMESSPIPRKRKRYNCCICFRSYGSYEQLQQHNKTHQVILQCPECDDTFNSSKLLAMHRLLCGMSHQSPTKRKRQTANWTWT